jgi:RHS repeat-associated protein
LGRGHVYDGEASGPLIPTSWGSTRALSLDDGTVATTYDYDAYGNPTPPTGFLQPFQFAGQYTDAESGLQYLRARYYDPTTAQFVARDPVAAKSREPYVYVTDSPPNATDPTGPIGGAICGTYAWAFVVSLFAQGCVGFTFNTNKRQFHPIATIYGCQLDR